jgi:hypothetical protein
VTAAGGHHQAFAADVHDEGLMVRLRAVTVVAHG